MRTKSKNVKTITVTVKNGRRPRRGHRRDGLGRLGVASETAAATATTRTPAREPGEPCARTERPP